MMNLAITAAATTTAETLVADLTSGAAKIYKERENGTYRKVHFLAEGTKEREHAEWIRLQREEGRSMKAIAAELHVSVSAVRRTINDLILTEELEEMGADELAEFLLGSEDDMAQAEPTTDDPDAAPVNLEQADQADPAN